MSETKPGAPDPSMEDILASIRKILNEDEQATESPAAAPAEDGPVVLTADMMIAPPDATLVAPAAEAPPPPAIETTVISPRPEPTPEPPLMAANAEPPPVAATDAGLVAPAAAAAAAAALGQLSRAVAQDRNAGVSRSGLSIEEVVREELRPLLKEWLDTHLPGITERLVRAEIERVMSRQG